MTFTFIFCILTTYLTIQEKFRNYFEGYMEAARRLIWNYEDLFEFNVEVCGEPPTEDRSDIAASGQYPFMCIITEDSDGDYHSHHIYPDEFVGELDASL